MAKKAAGIRLYLVLFNIIILCISFLCVIQIGLFSVVETAKKQTAQNLQIFAHTVVEYIVSDNIDIVNNQIDSVLKKIAKRDSRFRITVINKNGTVLGDSDVKDIATMENHLERPEVQSALSGSEKVTIRKSTVDNKVHMYYAMPIRIKRRVDVLRLSMPIETNVVFSSDMQRRLVFAFSTILVCTILCSSLVSAYISRQFLRLQNAAVHYAAGDFSYTAHISVPRELQQLSESLEKMAQQTQINIRDISQRRKELQAIFSGITEALIVFDTSLNIVKYNDTAETFFLTDSASYNSWHNGGTMQLIEFIRNTDILHFVESIIQERDKYHPPLSVQISRNDKIQTFLFRCVPISVDAENDRYVLIAADITKLKQLQEFRKDFVANVSHELKTPVTSIKGFAETLLESPSNNPAVERHFLEIINTQSSRLINILNDLLTLSRLDEENIPPSTEPCNIAELMQNICTSYQIAASQKNITISYQNNSTIDNLTILLDESLMILAIGNIIDNAIKYCPEHADITCSITNTDSDVVIDIQDTGPGISDMYRDRIFERFFRVDKGRSRMQGGTGLGLAISMHIVKIHKGTICEHSRSDGLSGACFEITIPLAPSSRI